MKMKKDNTIKEIKVEESRYSKGVGGESEMSRNIREQIVDIGIKSGFKIMSDWSPNDLMLEYKIRKSIYQ